MTAILKSKDGTGYQEMGKCTGYAAWAIRHPGLYDIPGWPENAPVENFERLLIERGVTRVSQANARAGDIVFFGDAHVAILGEDGKLHHNTTSGGVMSGKHTIDWWSENGGNKAGEPHIYRGFQQEIEVEVAINKESANETITDGNACYSLAGAKYGVYSGGTLLLTLTTNASGKAKGTVKVMPEQAKGITVRELSSSPGYGKDTAVYKKDGSSGKITITSKEPPAGDPATVLVYKSDAETGKNLNAGELKKYYPQKGGSLKGAVFKVDFYGITGTDYAAHTPLRTWHVETDANGYARLGEEWLADGYAQSAFYRDHITGSITLPLGFVTIQEIKAPEGYHLNSRIYSSRVDPQGENIIVHTYQESVVPDSIKRGDLDFIKIADDTQHRLANVPFLITALEEDGKETANGESHVIVTDPNGYASTASSFNSHSHKTNANDAAWNGTTIDEPKLDPSAGIWFGETSAINANKGALPYGKYKLTELPCSANEDYILLDGIVVDIARDGYTVELGTLSDKKNEIETVVWDSDLNEERVSLARKNVTLTDRVTMKGMIPGETYTLKGILMDKETGEPIKVNGKTVTAEKSFKMKDTSHIVDVDFTFDASGLAGKEVVVFQKLYQGKTVVANHEQLDNPNQAIEFLDPFIGTTATDPEFGANYSAADEEVTIVDKIKYSNVLRGGYAYEMVGTLMDKETGEPILADGKEVTASKKFTSNKASGTLEMEFTFDGSKLKGKDVVVFEEMYFDGEKIAEHKDINDEGQMIHFPEIGTTARDSETEDRISLADNEITVIDAVAYKNVKPGEEYTAEGSLIDRETGDVIATAATTFVAESKDGTAEVTFTFDGSKHAGKDAVIYEVLMFKSKPIADHTDPDDEKQTIHIPEIGTTATDSETKRHESRADGNVTIIDAVAIKNLIAGKEYKVSGVLMDKETGKELMAGDKPVTAEKTFTPDKPDGTVELEFTFDGSLLSGKTVVAFERVTYRDKEIAVHADINDENQSIHFPEIGTQAKDKADGNKKVAADKKATIVDTVAFKNLIAGAEYKLVGILMDKDSGKAVKVDGKEVTAEKTFKPEKPDGTVEVEFTFDSRELGDKTLVVFEKLYAAETVIAAHEDIDDEAQAVIVEKAKTLAVKTGDHMNLLFWAGLGAMALIIGAAVLIRRRRDA